MFIMKKRVWRPVFRKIEDIKIFKGICFEPQFYFDQKKGLGKIPSPFEIKLESNCQRILKIPDR